MLKLRTTRKGCALALLAFGLATWLAYPALLRRLSGASSWRALQQPASLSPAAQSMVRELRAQLGDTLVYDHHTHLAGLGEGSECWVNPRMRSLLHPAEWIRLQFYISAAGVQPGTDADLQYVERLALLARANPLPTRALLLAFDYRYQADGSRDVDGSSFYVPNEHVLAAVSSHPDLFEACVSVHPYRKDALQELRALAERGARFVKWLPNAMGIDPSSEQCAAYYACMHELGLILLTHTGEEQAVEAEADQELGNPLRLRRALDAGVRVIAAHCASSGTHEDLDHPGERRSSLELFLRLMDEPRYIGLLFGEISTITQINRYPKALAVLLGRSDLHARLVHGSDWPLPAINVLYSVGRLVEDGYLQPAQAAPLRELYDYHPLLFDLALKLLLRDPESGGGFGAAIFGRPAALQPLQPPESQGSLGR